MWWDISIVCLVISVSLWMFSKSVADPDLAVFISIGIAFLTGPAKRKG